MRSSLCFTALAAGLVFLPAGAEAQNRPLVGVVTYPVWLNGEWDVVSLTPPKWSYRLPFFAYVTNDSARLVRTSNTEQEIVYRLDHNITKIALFAAFDDSESCNPASDIECFVSRNGSSYSSSVQPLIATNINQATNWRKVNFVWQNPAWRQRYVKIRIAKTDGTAPNPQLMRVEINYVQDDGDHFGKSVRVDDLDDFSKMYSHTPDLAIASNNPEKFRLVTGPEDQQQAVDRQILYANSAHIDYFAVLNAYPDSSPQLFLDLLRSSQYKDDIKYCLIVFQPGVGETWSNKVARCVEYFQDSNYVRVLDGRPLVYFYKQEDSTVAEIDELCTASINAGTGDPYLVGMTKTYSTFLDAGSAYLSGTGMTLTYAGTGQTIPHVGFGANTLPRVDNPPDWWGGTWNPTDAELTASQMAPYVRETMTWCVNNPSKAPASSILINSWDEFCESAAVLCPRRDPSTGLPETSRLEAIGEVIKSFETRYYWDIDGATTGSGPDATPVGNWGGVDVHNWSTSDEGNTTATGWNAAAKTAVFAAGTDAAGSYAVTMIDDANRNVDGLVFEEGTVTLQAAGAESLTLSLDFTPVDVSSGATAILSVPLTGKGLTKIGWGRLVLSGANTYTGSTRVQTGILEIGGSGASNLSSNFTINSGATLRVKQVGGDFIDNVADIQIDSGGTFELNKNETMGGLSGAGNLDMNGTAPYTLTVGNGNETTTFSGNITEGTAGQKLTKVGNGTLTLSGANTYSGKTTVEGGTLSLTRAYLADGADVYLVDGVLLNLDFAGIDTIRSLYVNGSPQTIGTWGGPDSGALNTTPLISGRGVLGVTSGPPPRGRVSLTVSNAVLTLHHDGTAGFKYGFDYRDSLMAGSWLPLIAEPDFPPPEGWSTNMDSPPATITDTNAVDLPYRFYRLRTVNP